jgi:hypothetical protein
VNVFDSGIVSYKLCKKPSRAIMDDAPIPLSAEEARYWIAILESQIADNPTGPSGAVRSAAWRRFQSLRWLFLTEGPTDEAWQNVSYGPDLTTIPRMRFRALHPSPKSKPAKRPKADRVQSGYNLFVKDTLNDRKEEWADLTQVERIRRVAAEWSGLSKEEKQAFRANNADT